MTLHWYSATGLLIDSRWPMTISEGYALSKELSKLIGFTMFEMAHCKMVWMKNGKIVNHRI